MRRTAYTAGPWPGLTPAGAGVLLGCAALLGLALSLVGSPHQPLPDMPLLAVLGLAPAVLATRIVQTPGVASAVCGAYLLPRALASLLDPAIELPPLLLVPALAFDLAAWLQPADFASLKGAWPTRRRTPWRVKRRTPRTLPLPRAAVAGAVFGATWSLVEPPFAILLGADPSLWTPTASMLAAAASIVACAVVSLSARGTGS